LLIGDVAETQWTLALRMSLSPMGSLCVLAEEDAVVSVEHHSYAVIIIDAGAIHDAALLTRRLRTHRPEARIIIVTASPTWEYTREALQAGAADYIHKTFNQEELRAIVREVMDKPPPERPV
jgi:DNA-binding response OmpR family regulator